MAWAADPLVDEPKHLFEHFVHVSLERDSVSKELLFKIVKHQGFGNELPKDVQGFCFPDQAFIPPSKDPIGLFYTFVLTDFGGNRMYVSTFFLTFSSLQIFTFSLFFFPSSGMAFVEEYCHHWTHP